MVLSTEMAILKDTRDTRKRIGEILSAIDQLDRKANVRYRSDNRDRLNGLFVRDDIIGSDDPRLGVRWKKVDSDWQNAGSENASPSGDQIFGLMYGLYCVVHYSGDDDLATHAKAISSRLYDYAKRNHFILRLPNGDPTKRGSDMRWLSSLLHGLNKSITGEDLWDESRIEVGPTKPPLNGIGAFWDTNHTPETIARLIGRKLAIPVIDFEADLNSFALHIMFMALAPSKVWSQKELEQTAIKANHQLSVLWYCHAHGKQPNRFNEQTIQEILDACPETGPAAANAPKTGWQTESRWIRCTRIYEPHTGDEVYNGLDWLVLHNFCQLVYFGGSK